MTNCKWLRAVGIQLQIVSRLRILAHQILSTRFLVLSITVAAEEVVVDTVLLGD